MQTKRTELEIARDILTIVRAKNGRIKPTHILYKSNLSYRMMQEYLDKLIKKGFLIEVPLQKSKTYSITDAGRNFLVQYGVVTEFITTFGLGNSI
jgi:predicted transcriptional regulator